MAIGCLGSSLVLGCSGVGQDQRNDRSTMEQGTVTIKAQTFKVAVARTSEELRIGLMNVEPDELGQDEGMLFVFPREQLLSFWMKNTLMPLDVAYVDAGGTIVRIHTMKALDLSSYPSGQPARYALEVHAGRLAALSIREGDVLQFSEGIPEAGTSSTKTGKMNGPGR